MGRKQYSEEDLQSYIDGSFDGDVHDIELFIAENTDAKSTVELYRKLFVKFGQLQEDAFQPVNLPVTVISAIHAKQSAKQAKEASYVSLSIAVVGLIAIGVAAKMIFASYAMPGIAAVIVMAILFSLFTKVELNEKRRLYDL